MGPARRSFESLRCQVGWDCVLEDFGGAGNFILFTTF
jgi:hypothetical protein